MFPHGQSKKGGWILFQIFTDLTKIILEEQSVRVFWFTQSSFSIQNVGRCPIVGIGILNTTKNGMTTKVIQRLINHIKPEV